MTAPDVPPYQRGHLALTVRCPWCHAIAGAWCHRIGRGVPQPKVGFLHPSRVESVGMEFTPTVPERDSRGAQ